MTDDLLTRLSSAQVGSISTLILVLLMSGCTLTADICPVKQPHPHGISLALVACSKDTTLEARDANS